MTTDLINVDGPPCDVCQKTKREHKLKGGHMFRFTAPAAPVLPPLRREPVDPLKRVRQMTPEEKAASTGSRTRAFAPLPLSFSANKTSAESTKPADKPIDRGPLCGICGRIKRDHRGNWIGHRFTHPSENETSSGRNGNHSKANTHGQTGEDAANSSRSGRPESRAPRPSGEATEQEAETAFRSEESEEVAPGPRCGCRRTVELGERLTPVGACWYCGEQVIEIEKRWITPPAEPRTAPPLRTEALITDAVMKALRSIEIGRVRIKAFHLETVAAIDDDSNILSASIGARFSIIFQEAKVE